MSFADLRSARKSKEAKSYVEAYARTAQGGDRLAPPDTLEGDHSTVISKGLPPLVSGLALSGLPPTLEIRESSDYGRGLYAKQGIPIGTLSIS